MGKLLAHYPSLIDDFNLGKSQFDRDSSIHGILHTYRVMVYTLLLGIITGRTNDALYAFFSAYIHDMSRKHDGYCTRHGHDASIYKLPLYAGKFIVNGAKTDRLTEISIAVAWHSKPHDPKKNNPANGVIQILKDADALDRIRLGPGNLDPSYLRLPETIVLIEYAEKLYRVSTQQNPKNFIDIILLAESLLIEYKINI